MNARGFSLIELLVAMAITIAITSGMFSFIQSARVVFEVDSSQHTDIQQRARVATDALFRDLVMAGAGLQSPAVAPYRRGSINADMPGSAFRDRVSVLYVPSDTASPITVTYGRRVDTAGVPHFTWYDGAASEMPLVDQVVGLRFEYLDADGQLMVMDRFADGPWVPDAVSADRFDADLRGNQACACICSTSAGTRLCGSTARGPRNRDRCVAAKSEPPVTLVIALMSLVLLSAIGGSLAIVMNTDMRAAANFAAAREARYAADGALEIGAQELSAVAVCERAVVRAARSPVSQMVRQRARGR